MNVNYIMRVQTRSGVGLNIRNGPSIGFTRIGGLSEGAEVHCTQTENGWYLHDAGGWSSGNYLALVRDLGGSSGPAAPPPPPPEPPPMTPYEEELLNSLYKTIDYSVESIDSLRYLFGAPMQFTSTTDPRPEKSKLGRKYIETMLSDMSMLLITPGKAAFMKDFGERASNAMVKKLLGMAREDTDTSSLKDILEGKQTGRYYTFESDYAEYMKYVNNMCRLSATLLGIGDRSLFDGSKKYYEMDWDVNNLSDKASSKLFNFITLEKSVPFYIDAKQSSFSDGMSNSTDASMLAGALGKGSDISKEALFLFGKGYQDQALLDTSKINYEGAVNKVLKTLTKNDALAKQVTDRVSDHATTIINGGNVAFPEIWKDSSYNKSYNIEIKLVSPYGDTESFYLYILVPLWHLIAFSFPRQLGANGYINPFLVRAFCKGWFNCTMGIVDSISIKRASQEGWSVKGYPTEVDVSISIKDLYENMALSRAGDFSTFHNTEYLDMIATWCGVNMNKPEFSRKWDLFTSFFSNKVKDFLPNISDEIEQDIGNILQKYLK